MIAKQLKLAEDPQHTAADVLQRVLRLRAGGAVKRYHTFPTLGNQSVGEHSHAVCILIMALCPEPTLNLVLASQYHDLAEYDTGDCPANVKWAYPAMQAMLELAENHINDQLGIEVPLTDSERNWLKLCDTLEYCTYSLDQRRLGNMNMDIVFARGMKRLESYPLASEPQVASFIEKLKWAYAQARKGISPDSVAITHSHELDA